MAQTKEAQILCMKRYLEKDGITPETLLKVFKSLSKIQLTVELLQSTGIGKLVNGFRKYEGKVGERAKALVSYWKTLVSTTVTEEKKAKAEAERQAAEREATRKTDMDIVDLVDENARMAKLKQELQILKDKLKNSRTHQISESSSSSSDDDNEVTSTTQHVSAPASKKRRKTKTKTKRSPKAKSRGYDDSPPRDHNDILEGLKDDDSDAEAHEKEISHQRRMAEWEAKQRAEIAKLKAEKRRIEELREQRRIAREKKINKLYENEPMLFSPDSAMTVLVKPKPKPKPKPIPETVVKTKREMSVSPNPSSRERTRDSNLRKNKREMSVSPNPNSRERTNDANQREMSVSPNPNSRERTGDSKPDGRHEHRHEHRHKHGHHGHGHRSHDGHKSHKSSESTERKKDRSHDGKERSHGESKHHHRKSDKSRDSENERKNDSRRHEHKSDRSREARNHGRDSDTCRSNDSKSREQKHVRDSARSHDSKSREHGSDKTRDSKNHKHKSDKQRMEQKPNSQTVSSEGRLHDSKTGDEKLHDSKNHRQEKHAHESRKSSSQKRSADVSDFDNPNKKVKVENLPKNDIFSNSPQTGSSRENSDAELDFSGAGIEEEWAGSDQDQKGLSFEDFLSYDAKAKMKSGKPKSSSSSKDKHKSHKSSSHGNHDKHSHKHRDKSKSEKTSRDGRHGSHSRGKDSEKSRTAVTSSDGNRSQDGESSDGKKFKPRRSTLTLSPLDIPQPSMKLSLSQRDILSSVSALPQTQPDYKPLHLPDMDGQSRHANKPEVEGDFLSNKKKSRTQVYSGRKTTYLTEVPRLYDACMMVLMNHLENLECIGGVPYDIIKPVLEKCTPSQLYTLEDYNPHLVEDSDELWQMHCKKDFRKYSPDEMESWRELYLRLHDEREARLKKLTTNISASMAAKLPVRTTKLAFVNSAAKAPREVLRRQRQLGTAGPMSKTVDPLAKLSSHGGGIGKSKYVKPSDHAEMFKPQKMTKQVAPMMAKTLKMMKKCKR